MKKTLVVASVLCAIACTPAWGQAQVPAREMWGVGGDLGAFIPADDAYGNALDLQGFAEYYLTPRAGVRMGIGWATPSRGGEASVRATRVTIDLTYNWERGQTHPFVGAGLGAFFLQPRVAGNSVGDSSNELGANLFGGLEYFTGRTVSVKGEARYQVVGSDRLPDMHGLTLSIGLKKYF